MEVLPQDRRKYAFVCLLAILSIVASDQARFPSMGALGGAVPLLSDILYDIYIWKRSKHILDFNRQYKKTNVVAIYIKLTYLSHVY